MSEAREEPFAARFREQFFKSKLCTYNLRGKCMHQDRCKFAHSLDELHQGPNLCNTRMCPRGRACADPECQFAHDPTELRATEQFAKVRPCQAFARGICKLGLGCRFSHGPESGGGVSAEAASGTRVWPAGQLESQLAPYHYSDAPRAPSGKYPFDHQVRPLANSPIGSEAPPLPQQAATFPSTTEDVGYAPGPFQVEFTMWL